ncbi:hypothetical protein ES332_A05G209700v1 [Gossypium tomentosum]|uniref:Uncharacterized protein n=1 Tax=Gossypium tomentosum TaxID=34277 RepID=A0A5D2QIE5_GOSTO|nr:hypothetical protein ES332_A05G209700v1 [Gossypium tomentosum]
MPKQFSFSLRHLSEASPVIKLMNSDAHSCTVSLASLDIFALTGRDFFFHYAIRISYGEESILFFRRIVRDVSGQWAADGAGLVSFPSYGKFKKSLKTVNIHHRSFVIQCSI